MAKTVFIISTCMLILSLLGYATIQYDPFPSDPGRSLAESVDETKGNLTESNSKEIPKRWYGVPPLPNGALDPNPHFAYPWPVICPGKQWIRYCFKDQRSMDMLMPVLREAILRWTPAFQHSSLRIQPDLGCNGVYECLCSHVGNNGERVNVDSVVISNGETNGDWRTRQIAMHSTMGYRYNDQTPWRHYLVMGLYNTDDPNSDTFWSAVAGLTHELGHVAGLQHEHQRPDRDAFVEIHWENIVGYDEAANRVATSGDPAFAGMTDKDQMMNQVVQSVQLTRTYWYTASAYIRGDLVNDWQNYQSYQPFDLYSIMIYPHFMMAKPGTRTMERKDRVNGGEIWAGGHPSPQYQGLSPGDKLRITMLYPIPVPQHPLNPRSAPNNESDVDKPTPWSPLSVVIPHLATTTVRPPPPFGTDDVKEAEKNNYGCPGCWTYVKPYVDFEFGTSEPQGQPSTTSTSPSDFSPGTALNAAFPPIPHVTPPRDLTGAHTTTTTEGNADDFIEKRKRGDAQ